MKSVRFNSLASLVMAVALTIGLAACGGSSSTTPTPEPMPDPIEVERDGISAALAAAEMAVAAVNDEATDDVVAAADMAVAAAMQAIAGATHITSGEASTNRASLATIQGQLNMAKASRTMSMTLASQRMGISDALAAARTAVDAVQDDSDDATVTAAEQAVMAASAAIDAAGDIPSSEAAAERTKVATLQSDLDAAKASRQMALDDAAAERQAAMEEEARRTEQLAAITMAIDVARTAVAAVNDGSTQQEVDDANDAVANARAKIDEADDVAESVKATHMASVDTIAMSLSNAETSRNAAIAASQELANQRMAISNAIAAAQAAVDAVGDDSSEAVVEAAQEAITDAKVVIAGQADVPQAEKDANNGTVDAIMAQFTTARESRTAKMEADALAERERMAMAAATAAKLYKGIYPPAAVATGTGVGDVHAAYNDAGTPTDAAADTHIMVTYGSGGDTPVVVTRALSEDKRTTVTANHGWQGKRYHRTTPASEGTYEAFVYSNVEDSTEGRKFGHADPGTGEGRDYEYMINADGILDEANADGVGETADAFVPARVDSPNFDQSAGIKEFDLPENTVAVMIAGSYHGVSGTYSCEPTDGNTCASQVATTGFTLGMTADDTNVFTPDAGTWTFTPSNSSARVTEATDTAYASYGWWLHKTENDLTYTASAFVDEKGAVPAAEALDALNGTARYVGGAAGKYALTSATGGTNDSGHFTARATLEADFTNNSDSDAISGTIDTFIGADGQPRNWSVKLNESDIGDTGGIGSAGDGTDPVMTVWTIGDTDGAADGNWTGTLRNNGDDGVPQVATGTFYSTHGTLGGEGRMVGAFGADRE